MSVHVCFSLVTSDKKWQYHIALCGEQNIPVRPDIAGDAIVQTSLETDSNDPEVHVVGTKIIARHGGGWLILKMINW